MTWKLIPNQVKGSQPPLIAVGLVHIIQGSEAWGVDLFFSRGGSEGVTHPKEESRHCLCPWGLQASFQDMLESIALS